MILDFMTKRDRVLQHSCTLASACKIYTRSQIRTLGETLNKEGLPFLPGHKRPRLALWKFQRGKDRGL